MIVVLYIYQIQDHKIKLKSSKQLIVKRIYTLYKKKIRDTPKIYRRELNEDIYYKISIIHRIFNLLYT